MVHGHWRIREHQDPRQPHPFSPCRRPSASAPRKTSKGAGQGWPRATLCQEVNRTHGTEGSKEWGQEEDHLSNEARACLHHYPDSQWQGSLPLAPCPHSSHSPSPAQHVLLVLPPLPLSICEVVLCTLKPSFTSVVQMVSCSSRPEVSGQRPVC